MPATITDLHSQLAEAVASARQGRHHASCNCFLYRQDDEAFCSMAEWRWSRTVDRLLNLVR